MLAQSGVYRINRGDLLIAQTHPSQLGLEIALVGVYKGGTGISERLWVTSGPTPLCINP